MIDDHEWKDVNVCYSDPTKRGGGARTLWTGTSLCWPRRFLISPTVRRKPFRDLITSRICCHHEASDLAADQTPFFSPQQPPHSPTHSPQACDLLESGHI
jgi:hypothetical protein